MKFGNKLLEETYSNTIEEAIAQLENIAPSNVGVVVAHFEIRTVAKFKCYSSLQITRK